MRKLGFLQDAHQILRENNAQGFIDFAEKPSLFLFKTVLYSASIFLFEVKRYE